MRRVGLLVAVVICAAAAPSSKDPAITLRMAAIAPDGSSWARLARQFSEEVERDTGGRVRIKWQLGGIAGDERRALDLVAAGALEGVAGATFCQRIAPSLRALEVAGLVQSDEEAAIVIDRLRAQLDAEARATPFRLLVVSPGFGHRVLFSRTPVRTLDDLRRLRVWVYDLDEVEREQLSLMGVHVVPLPVAEAGPAYDAGRVDGIVSIPGAAVAWGYGVKARWFTDLDSMFLPGCLAVSARAFDALDEETRAAITAAGARLQTRFTRLGLWEHEELLTRVFPRQGLRALPMSPEFRRQYMDAARAVSARLAPRFVPLSLVRRLGAILDEQRGRRTQTSAR